MRETLHQFNELGDAQFQKPQSTRYFLTIRLLSFDSVQEPRAGLSPVPVTQFPEYLPPAFVKLALIRIQERQQTLSNVSSQDGEAVQIFQHESALLLHFRSNWCSGLNLLDVLFARERSSREQ